MFGESGEGGGVSFWSRRLRLHTWPGEMCRGAIGQLLQPGILSGIACVRSLQAPGPADRSSFNERTELDEIGPEAISDRPFIPRRLPPHQSMIRHTEG